MNIIFKYVVLSTILASNIFPSSSLRSLMFPGWGERNEFNILSENNDFKDIEYIEKRSKAIMITEVAILISLLTSKELSQSYNNDYELLGTNNAGVDWSGKDALYAANVGNFDNFFDYNEDRLLNNQFDDQYNEGEGYEWDWQENNSNRLRYDKLRNKSEQLDSIREYMLASLIINRIISAFDVLSIKRNHGRLVTFDMDNNENNLKFNLNYPF